MEITPKTEGMMAQARGNEAPCQLVQQKIRSMCLQADRDPQRRKSCGKVSPFEAILSLEQRRALATWEVMSKDRNGLDYLYQVAITSVPQSSSPMELQKGDEDNVSDEKESLSCQARHLLNRREANHPRLTARSQSWFR